MAYQLEDVQLVAKTEKAILIQCPIVDGGGIQVANQFWIPKSAIKGSDLDSVGDVGCIEVKDWFAKKMEWEDE